jgi:hypothetical protein
MSWERMQTAKYRKVLMECLWQKWVFYLAVVHAMNMLFCFQECVKVTEKVKLKMWFGGKN